MAPLFLDPCHRKNPMRENRCGYLRVFLLSNIRVQSGCRNWPTQQIISLAAIPHSLREISWLKHQKILPVAPQHETALQPQHLPKLDCVSPSLSHVGPASSFLACVSPRRPCVSSGSLYVCCAGPSDALRSTWLPLREPLLALRHPPWLLRCSPDTISTFSVSLYSMPLSCSPNH